MAKFNAAREIKSKRHSGCDLGAIDRQQSDLVIAARITFLLGPDRFGDPALAGRRR
jgi:hypothetical protein